MKYAWIEAQGDSYPVSVMCAVLGVSTSGYYAWRSREPSQQRQRRERIARAAERSHQASGGVYGYRKVHEDLKEQEIACCLETVRRVLAEKGLFSRTRRKFVVTTDSAHDMPVAENLLDRDFTATEPNQKWAADISYLWMGEGWFYLAVVMDLFSRRIVGWAMSASLRAPLVLDALQMALDHHCPQPGQSKPNPYFAPTFSAPILRVSRCRPALGGTTDTHQNQAAVGRWPRRAAQAKCIRWQERFWIATS